MLWAPIPTHQVTGTRPDIKIPNNNKARAWILSPEALIRPANHSWLVQSHILWRSLDWRDRSQSLQTLSGRYAVSNRHIFAYEVVTVDRNAFAGQFTNVPVFELDLLIEPKNPDIEAGFCVLSWMVDQLSCMSCAIRLLYRQKCIPNWETRIRALYHVNGKVISLVQMMSRSVLLVQKSQSCR